MKTLKVPENWQELHKCSAFSGLDEQRRCLFCRMNAPGGDFGKMGFEAIPFDVPGVYNPKGTPNLLVRKCP